MFVEHSTVCRTITFVWHNLPFRNASVKHASHFDSSLFWFVPVVLHTGKRWFIICPVDEPSVSQDVSSEGATATPHTSGLSDGTAPSQAADSSTAQPVEHCTAPASTGNVKFP